MPTTPCIACASAGCAPTSVLTAKADPTVRPLPRPEKRLAHLLAPSLFASPSKTAAADGADYCAAAQAFVPAAKAMAVIADIATKALPERFIKIIPRAGLLSVSCFTLNTPILLGAISPRQCGQACRRLSGRRPNLKKGLLPLYFNGF